MAQAKNGFDVNQIVRQIAGNPDLLRQLQGLGSRDTQGAKTAIRGAGIPISGEQAAMVMGILPKLLGSIDVGAAMKGVDLSDGFDMKDIQGIMGGLMGGRR